jgi:hypothetical protein
VSRDGTVTLDFGGEERDFRLNIGRLRVLQERTDAGPLELIRRYESGAWKIDDLREPILQGLIGGGMDQASATRLVTQFFDGQPYLSFVRLAQAIVMVALVGAPEEEAVEETEPGEPRAPATTSPTERSVSGGSTSAAPPSSSTPDRSIN